jgi:hypothetical protein
VLKDSFIGDSKTIMIANIGPNSQVKGRKFTVENGDLVTIYGYKYAQNWSTDLVSRPGEGGGGKERGQRGRGRDRGQSGMMPDRGHSGGMRMA